MPWGTCAQSQTQAAPHRVAVIEDGDLVSLLGQPLGQVQAQEGMPCRSTAAVQAAGKLGGAPSLALLPNTGAGLLLSLWLLGPPVVLLAGE